MSGRRPLLSRGRSPTALVVTAVVISFVSGILRQHVMIAATSFLVEVPFSALRRIALGLLIDLPAVLLTILVCAVIKRVMVVEKPWIIALGLTALVWLVDLVMALLIADIMVLWTDYLVLVPRLIAAAAAALGSALVLGWRPERSKGASAAEEENE